MGVRAEVPHLSTPVRDLALGHSEIFGQKLDVDMLPCGEHHAVILPSALDCVGGSLVATKSRGVAAVEGDGQVKPLRKGLHGQPAAFAVRAVGITPGTLVVVVCVDGRRHCKAGPVEDSVQVVGALLCMGTCAWV